MKVLVLNTGSSSVKYRVYDCEDGRARDVARGIVERIGSATAEIRCSCASSTDTPCMALAAINESESVISDHRAAINRICQILLCDACGILEDISEIRGIGHRVVHGGEQFSASTLIDRDVITAIEDCCRLAPLHNPPALQGIRACDEVFPGVPQVAVFDTAFHATIPPEAYHYPLPMELYKGHGVRKYGFHGTSHLYVSRKAVDLLDMPEEDTRVITCHLGNGSSISAVKGGKCIDTSMGLTPLGGVMMGTRPGDLDPYLPLFMTKALGMSVDEVDKTLNKKSGLLGICGHNDMRDIEERAEQGDAACQLALDMFANRIAHFIGSYAMAMNGCDAIVFTAGIGENDAAMRKRILENAGYLGCFVDDAKNDNKHVEISTQKSTCRAFVIPTNEELVIATDTAKLVAQTTSLDRAAAVN